MRLICALLMGVFCCSATNSLESRLQGQMRFWQKRLGMEDWNMTLRVVRQKEISPDAWGSSEWDPERKTAVINVLDPRDYNLKGGELKLDMECTIVHELVHIQVSPLAAPDAQVREEVVNGIMGALLNRTCPN